MLMYIFMPNKIVLTYIHILTLVNKIFDISAIKVKIRSRQINALSLILVGCWELYIKIGHLLLWKYLNILIVHFTHINHTLLLCQTLLKFSVIWLFFYYQMLSLMCYCGRVFDVSVSLHSNNFIKHQMLR